MDGGVAGLIATISAALAAIFSAVASFQAWQQSKETRKLWARERRSEAFRALVRDPIIRTLDSFVDNVKPLLSDGASTILTLMEEGAPAEQIDAARAALIEEFNSAFLAYRERLRQARLISDSSEFRDELGGVTEALQDDVTLFVEELAQDGDPDERSVALLTDHAASVDRIAVKYDPALADD